MFKGIIGITKKLSQNSRSVFLRKSKHVIFFIYALFIALTRVDYQRYLIKKIAWKLQTIFYIKILI